jgi:uncharacterized repeat protein (TIGR04076 family)
MNDSFELYDLHVEVVAGERAYVCSHHTGQGFDVVGENLIFAAGGSFSMYALAALLPLLPVKQRMTHANDWITTDALIACPDPYCGARFKISRVGLHSFKHSDCTVVPLTTEKE